ncbi:MAG: ribonuclease III [Dehalococcoidia bacterium]|nr:ribonuclease III [Dehalococcoidia bacterium]
MADIADLQAILGVDFQDIVLLQQSLVHRSYLNENGDLSLPSNERLEFLGDAVLGFVVADQIYKEFPELSEGELTKLRSALVRRETLSRIALALGLGEYLYLGRGEEESGGRRRPRNLSCALEAVIGAIYIDRGLEATTGFINRILRAELEEAIEDKLISDYKSRLQQYIQSERKVTPSYRTVEEIGPDHAKLFTVEVLAGERVLAQGRGRSKQEAEMDAARAALDDLRGR